ncbi:MAG: hypothetical protein GWN61_06650 [candidate division Zixibacteria bacterium]|nr:nucleotidyltransferase domain-containing protein [candidate division Zixibacteria bacterium]NIV05862.1 hypothetical protein [candidate division Zixibacteria bacterium]
MNRQIEKIIKSFSDDTKKILQDNLVAEYLFGSVTRNQENQYSDIDILIIVKQFDHQLRKQLSELSSEYSLNYDVYISPIIKELDVWQKNKIHDTLFYQEIQRDGVQLC